MFNITDFQGNYNDLTMAEVLAGVTAEDVAEFNRGLSNSNKVTNCKTIIKLINQQTGDVIEIDKAKSRISRLRRRVFAWCKALHDLIEGDYQIRHRKVMITLTYVGVDDWRPNHIKDYMFKLRRKLGDRLLAYAWVAELQERGAVHYHIELIVKRGTKIPTPDKSGMWPWGLSKIETARTLYYVCSYVGKEYQKMGVFPKGLRMFAVWIAPDLISFAKRWEFRLSTLPSWFADVVIGLTDLIGEKWERAKGGGYWYANKRYRSPFVFAGVSFA